MDCRQALDHNMWDINPDHKLKNIFCIYWLFKIIVRLKLCLCGKLAKTWQLFWLSARTAFVIFFGSSAWTQSQLRSIFSAETSFLSRFDDFLHWVRARWKISSISGNRREWEEYFDPSTILQRNWYRIWKADASGPQDRRNMWMMMIWKRSNLEPQWKGFNVFAGRQHPSLDWVTEGIAAVMVVMVMMIVMVKRSRKAGDWWWFMRLQLRFRKTRHGSNSAWGEKWKSWYNANGNVEIQNKKFDARALFDKHGAGCMNIEKGCFVLGLDHLFRRCLSKCTLLVAWGLHTILVSGRLRFGDCETRAFDWWCSPMNKQVVGTQRMRSARKRLS